MANQSKRLGIVLAVVFFAFLVTSPARAEDQFGVARISVLHGNVTIQRGDSGDNVAAALNAPVMVGDYLSTTGGARTEVQFDNANFVRIGSDAQARFTHLDANNHAMQLAEGTIELRVLRFNDANPEIDTPSIGIRPSESGSYRVTVTHDGDTILSVRSGRADLLAPYGTQSVAAGASVLVRGPSSKPVISSIDTVAYDDFDAWNSERDQYAKGTYGSAYANPDIVGLDDLNAYGRWVGSGDYGHVWVPYRVADDWAPYRDGRWAWEPGCGWTWVGYEPWGWAPYHYGRWFYAPVYGWAWYPGPVYIAPVWRPAFVAFFSFGNGFNFNLGFGNIGWVPLAPFEDFNPWWGGGLAYSRIINTTNITNITYNITNITNVYQNANKPRALGIVARHEFENGTTYHYMPVHRAELEKVAVIKGALPVVPTHANLHFNDVRPVHVALSPHFNDLPGIKAPRSFQEERKTLQTIVQKATPPQGVARVLPITPIRGERAVPNGAASTPVMRHESALNTAASPRTAAPKALLSPKATPNESAPTSAWTRFATARGEAIRQPGLETAHAVNAPIPTRSLQARNVPTLSAPATTLTTSRAVAPKPSSVWNRFSSADYPVAGHHQTSQFGNVQRVEMPVQRSYHPTLWQRFPSDNATIKHNSIAYPRWQQTVRPVFPTYPTRALLPPAHQIYGVPAVAPPQMQPMPPRVQPAPQAPAKHSKPKK